MSRAQAADGERALSQVLSDALRGRPRTAFEEHLVEVLHHDIFRRVDNLRASEQAQLAYQRLRYLRAQTDIKLSDLMSDLERLLALHEWVGIVDGTLMTILTIHFNLCIGSILQHGCGKPALRPLLDELDRMDSVGVFLATELAYGNNVQALETQATYDHTTREFVIHTPRPQARKFMPNTGAEGIPKLGVVLARLFVGGVSRGVYPFVVRIRTESAVCPGVSVVGLGDKPDYALDNAITSFDRVRIPFDYWLSGADSQIDEAGNFTSTISSVGKRFLSAMDRVQLGKLCLASGALSVMRSSLDLTLRYACQRRTFAPGRRGASLIQYRTYQQGVFEGVATAYASSFLLQRVRKSYDTRTHETVGLNRLLAIGKVYVSTQAIQVMAKCRERVGAQGLFSANRIVSYWIQTNGVVTAEGDNEILLARMARELLGGHDGYVSAAPLPDSFVASIDSSDDMIAALAELERRSLLGLRASLSSSIRERGTFDAWNAHVVDAVAVASLHVQRIALETFAEQVSATRDERARLILERLLRVALLQEVAKYAGILLAAQLLSVELVQSLSAERARLAELLFPDIDALIEAFDIPQSLLDVPIAVDYVAAYDRIVTEVAATRASEIRELRPDAPERSA